MSKISVRDDAVARLVLAFIKELFARDLIVLDRIDANFLDGLPLASGFGGDVEGEVNGELIRRRAVEERAGHGFAVERLVGAPVFGFFDDGTLADGFLAIAFNGHDVGRIHRAHDVKVFALPAQLHEFMGHG